MKKLISLTLCLFLGIGLAMAQTITVKGVVISSVDNEPIIGASVLARGTSIGAYTDIDGAFTLNNVPSSATLVISYVGMITQEVAASANVRVVLALDAQAIDEVVVTAMGLSRKSKALGYASQQVKSEELTQARQMDLNDALVGKVSGVRILGNSGATFDAGTIVLRGTSSITSPGGNEPIYVIDGVIGNKSSINMDDVESLNVLKGPAATALYGSRGGNGAIIITTKGAKGESSEFSITHTLSFENVYFHVTPQSEYGGGYMGADGVFPTFQYNPAVHPSYLQPLNGLAYYDYANDASWGPKFDGRQYAAWYTWDPSHPDFGKTEKWESRMNLNDLFKTGVSNTTNVSFARSGKDYMSRVSFTNTNREGIAPNSDAVRRHLSVKTQFKPIDRLTVTLDYKYTYHKNHNALVEGYGGTGNALYTYLQWGHTNVDLKQLKDYKRPDGTFRSWNITEPDDLTPQFHDNPFALHEEMNRVRISQWNVFSADALLDIVGNLKAGIRLNGNIRNNNDETPIPLNFLGEVGSYTQTQNSLIDTQIQGRLTWSGSFAEDRLNIDAAAFVENRNYKYDVTQAFTRDGIFLDKFFSTNASNGLPGGSTTRTWLKEESIFGTATVGWDGTYYLDFSLRNDWTSTLHPDSNSYLYGGVSGSILLNNLIKKNWLNFWKLRASMAQVGSSMSAYEIYPVNMVRSGSTLVKYGSLSNMWYDSNLKDPDIRPTISTSYEVGTEFRLFNHRLWGDFNFYNRDSKDQIINVNTTPSSGYSTRKMNAGLIRNRGVELTLGGALVQTKSVSWDITANISKNNNTLVELVEGQDAYQIYWTSFSSRVYTYAEVGKPVGVIRGSTWSKDPEGRIIMTKRADPNHAYGPYQPQVVTGAQEELGSTQPDFTGGFSTGLRYKNIRLNASFDFQIGGNLASVTNMFGEGSGIFPSTVGNNDKGNPIRNSVANGGGVRIDGVESNGQGGYTPVTAYVDANYYYQSRKSLIWEDYVYDASYVKLRAISIAYDVPARFLQKINIGVKKASISLIAQNPWLIYSAIPNIDPSEAGAARYNYLEMGQAASTRSVGFTLNLTF